MHIFPGLAMWSMSPFLVLRALSILSHLFPGPWYLAPGPKNFAHALDLSFTSTKYICSTCICRLGYIVSSSSFFGPVALYCKWQTQPKILRSNQKKRKRERNKKKRQLPKIMKILIRTLNFLFSFRFFTYSQKGKGQLHDNSIFKF